ncbi:MAG: amidohydrolase family protein [Dehalococcoidales bacterium]|nr:MAG: amidohydrolase family protein [Dehalococcoidales bacterium]
MPSVDLVFRNANVITMDPVQPRAELVAVRDGKVWLVGGKDEVSDIRGSGTKIIDCQGKTLVPGYNDSHCHIFSFLRKLLSIDLSPPAIGSITDIKETVARQAQKIPPGQWITGTDYNEFYLEEKRHPNRRDIDEVAPDHPVVLSHRSLHACVLNSRALALAGINRETPEPPGALIERDLTDGEPNGILYEMLGFVREKVMPPWTEEELNEGMKLANQQYLSQGLTSLQDATVVNDYRRWQAFRRFIYSGRFRSRIYMMFGPEASSQFGEAGLAFGAGDNQLRLGGLKIVPSSPGGQLYPPQPELNRMILEAHQQGFQVAVHAVRDSTVEAVATAYEYAQTQLPELGRRHRVEHCAECPPPLLERLRRLQAVIATQPPFFYYSGERYLAMVPEETLPYLYRIRSFFDAGVIVAGSSDSPIVSNNPLVGIYSAVTRRTTSGEQLQPEETISPEQALAMYTTNAAYASHEEGIKGSITPGKLADMVLLSDDPTRVDAEAIKDIKVEMTISGGEIVWEA